MRIGVYGGTFDPVHVGHLLLAEQCREQLRLDQVWFLPAAHPPHKPGAVISPPKDRLAMLELAVAGHPEFVVSDFEIQRGGISFTVETLDALHSDFPDNEWFLLVGGDSLSDFPTWREPQRILELATLVAVNRGRRPVDPREALRLLPAAAENVQVVEMPAVDLASTDLRQRVSNGKSIRYMTPRAVECYVLEHELYRQSASE